MVICTYPFSKLVLRVVTRELERVTKDGHGRRARRIFFWSGTICSQKIESVDGNWQCTKSKGWDTKVRLEENISDSRHGQLEMRGNEIDGAFSKSLYTPLPAYT